MKPRIVFNGREYNSLDKMPVDVRKRYLQTMKIFENFDKNDQQATCEKITEIWKDYSGIPDILEQVVSTNVVSTSNVYHNFDQMPKEIRQLLEQKNINMAFNSDSSKTSEKINRQNNDFESYQSNKSLHFILSLIAVLLAMLIFFVGMSLFGK